MNIMVRLGGYIYLLTGCSLVEKGPDLGPRSSPGLLTSMSKSNLPFHSGFCRGFKRTALTNLRFLSDGI